MIYNPGTSLALGFLCSWLNAGMSWLGTLEIGQIPKMTDHTKLLIKWKVCNQIWWSWSYYNEEKTLYPARWKKITVDQSKVLKIDCIDCSVFLGPPGIWRDVDTHGKIKRAGRNFRNLKLYWKKEKLKQINVYLSVQSLMCNSKFTSYGVASSL